MDKRYCILIWHQAGGRNDNSVYYLWADKNENAYVFSSGEAAIEKWQAENMRSLHAGIVIELTSGRNYWI